jgi:hypothetical protein
MVAESAPRPTLVLNPPDDPRFRGLATRLIDEGVRTPAELEAGLRKTHPDAIVRPRDLVGERFSIWYVYREGRWVGSGG